MKQKKYCTSLSELNNHVLIDLRKEGSLAEFSDIPTISFPIHSIYNVSAHELEKIKMALLKAIKAKGFAIASNSFLLLCHDGLIRSKTIWELLRINADIYIYKGGYRLLKRSIRRQFEKNYNLVIIQGKTGSGKTRIIELLEKENQQIINLEKTAKHNGSVFGNLTQRPQPSQAQFEFALAAALSNFAISKPIILESEQINIGQVSIPLPFWKQMQKAKTINLVADKKVRTNRLVAVYAGQNDAELKNGIDYLSNKLSSDLTNTLLSDLDKGNYERVAVGLIDYYDRTLGYDIVESDAINCNDFTRALAEIKKRLEKKKPCKQGL